MSIQQLSTAETTLPIQSNEHSMQSAKRLARLAGVFYLILLVGGAFAQLYVRDKVYEPGDAVATAANIVANATLFRLGFVADLIMATVFLFVAMALHQLLKSVNKLAARAMVIFVSVAVAIICINLVFQFGALLVATDSSYAGLAGGSEAMVLLLMDLHHYGYLIAQMFFGLWLLPLGYLVFKSRRFPRVLGVLLMVGCFGYLAEMFGAFLITNPSDSLSLFTVPADLGEVGMILWLLIVGVRTPKPVEALR